MSTVMFYYTRYSSQLNTNGYSLLWQETFLSPEVFPQLNVVDGYIVLYGGSSEFDKETMQLQEYHGDAFVITSGKYMNK